MLFEIKLVKNTEEKEAKSLLKYGSDCHYSCNSCIGKEYYECTSCLSYQNNNSTVIKPYNYIDNVVYQSIKNLTIIYGECGCSSSDSQTSQYVSDGCRQIKSFDRFLQLAIQAMMISNLSFGALSFITQLKLFFLIDTIELYQFLGNFVLVNHKNFLFTPTIEKDFINLNPTFAMNEQEFSFNSFFEKKGGKQKYIKLEKLNGIKNIPSKEELNQQSDIVKKEDIYSQIDFIEVNKLQKSYSKLSNKLKEFSSNLTYFSMSINFQILMLASYIVMIVFLLSHFVLFEKKYSPNIKSNHSSPSTVFTQKQDEYRYKQKARIEYEKSIYFQIYSYMICFSLAWFYLSLNEQLIYLQISFFQDSLDSMGIVSFVVFIFLLLINLGQILYMARRSSNPLTRCKIIIFDDIKFINQYLSRNIVAIKMIFKIVEIIIFFQYYEQTYKQLFILLGLSLVQFVIIIVIKPFNQNQYNILSGGQHFIKICIISFHLGIQVCENNQDKQILEKLYLVIPALQFCYFFTTFLYNIVIYLQDIFFYCEKRKKQGVNSIHPLSNESMVKSPGNNDQSNLILQSGQKDQYLMSLNQSQMVESHPDQNGSILYEKQQSKSRNNNRSQFGLDETAEKQNSDYFNLGFKRKAGQQTEITISQPMETKYFGTNETVENQLFQNNTSNKQKTRTDYLINSRKKEMNISNNSRNEGENNKSKSPLQVVQEYRNKMQVNQLDQSNSKQKYHQYQNSNILQFDEINQTIAENINIKSQSNNHNTTYRR